MTLRKKCFLFTITIIYTAIICSCRQEKTGTEQWEKGYHLSVDEAERLEAETDCKRRLMTDSNKAVTNKTYSNIENYQEAEEFLQACMSGKSGSLVTYDTHFDGGIGRHKYIFDGTDMFVLGTSASWNEANEPVVNDISYNRIKSWRYTEKGWFCYQLCVPEPPEVTEIVDGSRMVRVKPMKTEYRESAEKYVLPLGYQGNNLLCTNWDMEHLEDLDYNGMYEYLYEIRYRKAFPSEDYSDGIPGEEFESLIMKYLPITSEQLRKYAAFDEETQTYSWRSLGCSNYNPTFFGTSIPEVTNIKENYDGTVTLTVDAVCEMILCDDAVITHELTMQFLKDGSFIYLGNKILGNGLEKMPEYQYRMGGSSSENTDSGR